MCFETKTCWLQNELCLFYTGLLEGKEYVSSLKRYFYCDICLGMCEGTIENDISEFQEVKGLNVQRIQPLSQRSQHGSLKWVQ